jgi:hypothetical protein
LKKKVGEITQGRRPSREFEKTTFEDLKGLSWGNFEKKEKGDKRRAAAAINHLEKICKGFKVKEITEQSIDRCERMRRADGVKPTTVNRELSVLKSMFHLGTNCKVV